MKRLSIRNINIKTKLFVLGGVSILGLIFMGAESIITAREINQASTEITQSWLPATILAEELNTDIYNYRTKEYFHVITHDQATMDHLERSMAILKQAIRQSFEAYENAYITNDEDRVLMENARECWSRYLEYSDNLLLLSRQRAKSDALEMVIGESNTMFDEASQNFVLMAEYNREGAEAASIHSDQLYSRVVKIKFVTVLLISVFIIWLVVYIIQSIDRPVKDILEGTRRVANGDLDVCLTYRSEDELGVLTDSVNQLIERLRNMIDDEKFLLREIGNGNYEVRSTCENAYHGDFAPILYSITGLRSRLELAKQIKEDYKKQQDQAAAQQGEPVKKSGGAHLERIDLGGRRAERVILDGESER